MGDVMVVTCPGHYLQGELLGLIDLPTGAVALVLTRLGPPDMSLAVAVPGPVPVALATGDAVVVLFTHGRGIHWPADSLEESDR